MDTNTQERDSIEPHNEDPPIPQEPYHDEEEAEPLQSEEETPRREYTYEPSVVSTQSAPPPYELYPPAKTVVGRIFNWLRKIPRLNTHQAIYLPTIHTTTTRSSSRSWLHRRTTSQSSIPSVDSSDSVSCWSYYYYAVIDKLPGRLVLPSSVARYRGLMLCISFFSLLLFTFLFFCSIFFAPTSYPDPVFPDKVTNDTARFLTLNIFMRPPLIKNNWSDYKDDRLAYIEKYILPDYDVITFQESFAFASRRKDRLITTARQMGYNYHMESPRKYPWDIGVDGGLLVISRFPIIQTDIIEYPRGQHSDWLSMKGALHALIQLNPTRKMHIYTTHTQASYDLNNEINEEDTFIRLYQFSLLHDFIYETAKDDEPIMVVGDLNVDAAVHEKNVPITQPSTKSSPEYSKMLDVIKGVGVASSDGRRFEHPWKMHNLTDIPYSYFGHHPVTFGDYSTNDQGQIEPAETVLTNWDQLLTVQSIDRLFWYDRDTNRVKLEKPKVEKFWVKENKRMTVEEQEEAQFTQISDHYGLSCDINII